MSFDGQTMLMQRLSNKIIYILQAKKYRRIVISLNQSFLLTYHLCIRYKWFILLTMLDQSQKRQIFCILISKCSKCIFNFEYSCSSSMHQPVFTPILTIITQELKPQSASEVQPFRFDAESHYDRISASRADSWNRVYQISPPNPKQSFFNIKQPERVSRQESARSAWAKFNPQKEQPFQFDVFKMLRGSKETTNNSSIDIEQPFLQELEPASLAKIVPQALPPNNDVFLLQPKKPPPFMGAFSHVQPGFGFFNINISVPASQEYKPFSCFYHDESEEEAEEAGKAEAGHLHVSRISAIQDIKRQDVNRYFFEIDSAESEISQIADKKSAKDAELLLRTQEKLEEQAERSVLWNYSALFEQRPPFKHRDPMWEQTSMQREVKQSRVFQVNKEWSLRVLHEMELQLNLAEQMKEVIPDEYILSQISKIMQNVECELFTLDYHKMEWSLDLDKFRLEHSFKSSLKYRIKEILLIANYRSRIDVALAYIRKRPFRRVYYELGVQITEIQILFQEIVLSEARACSIIEFFSKVQKLKLEMALLYKLLINQAYISQQGRSYQDFDYRYLNSQYVIFKEAVKQSRVADSLNSQLKPLLTNLLSAVFKPITSILNNILFEQRASIELNQEIYLKYFFDNHKDIVEFVSRKIALIKGESHELYQVCRMRDTIEIINDLQQLEEYEHRWQKVFTRKRKLIERIRKNYKLKVKSQREKRHEERMKFIYSLKSRIYQQQEEQNARKKQANLKNREQLQKLKREIDARQERRKLLEQLEKEKEKGLILDIALQEKQKLQKQKQVLVKRIQQINGQANQQKHENPSSKQEIQINRQNVSSIQQEMPAPFLQNKTSIKQQQVKPVESVSQQHIKSANSIDANKMAFTADNFLLRKNRNSSKISNNTQSYFRLAPKHQNQTMQAVDSPSSSDYSMEAQELSQNQQDFRPLSVQLSISRELDLSTSLEICFSDVIKKQLQIIQSSLSFLIIDKYEILAILNFMRNVLMSGNGERVQEFINIAISQSSMLNLKYFSECLLFDTSIESIERLEPYFYHSKRETRYNTEINIFEDNIQNYIGFQFRKLPGILQPYFAYTHISRYMQIFGFILRLKYCEKLINKSWKLLNSYKKDLQQQQKDGQDVGRWLTLLKRLYSVRYIINSFLITFENYMFLKIVEKEFKILKQSINNLHDLQVNHLKMLENIIRFTFIDNPNQNASKNLRRNLMLIHEFYQIIYQLTLDDIPLSQLKQTHQRVAMIQMHFKRQQQWMKNVIQKMN